MPEFSLPATERLKSKKQIQHIFAEGKSLKRFPLRLLYSIDPEDPDPQTTKMGVAVSSKRIGLAVRRNRIKRLIREAYRTQQNDLKTMLSASGKRIHLMFVYLADQPMEYGSLQKAMLHLLGELKKELENQ